MKKIFSVATLSALMLAGTSCLAADGFYVKGSLKYVMPSDPEVASMNLENDNGYGLGAAVGMTFGQFRIEGEIATQKTDLDSIGVVGDNTNVGIGSGDVRMTTYMVNGYFDIPVNDSFGFYVTAGLGYGTTTISIEQIDGDDSGFAWKGGAGVFYSFTPNLTMDIGWEYVTMDDADLDVDVTDLYTNNISASLRYTF